MKNGQKSVSVAIMQPYIFPYVGYFQLVNAVDIFVFYDDVNFINGGWINRNRILVNNQINYLTVRLKDASQNKLINEILLINNKNKLLKTIQMAYRKAPFYSHAWPVIEHCFDFETDYISELAIFSVKEISQYLGLNTNFKISSKDYFDTKKFDRVGRLIEICKRNNANFYINAVGGQDLYKKEDFRYNGIELFFMKTHFDEYKQFNNVFNPALSIIDIMMFNSKEQIQKMINACTLI